MLVVNVKRSADPLLRDLARRGLVVKLETTDAERTARHWHLGDEKRSGVLDVTDLGDTCELGVAANRDGGWATALFQELAESPEARAHCRGDWTHIARFDHGEPT